MLAWVASVPSPRLFLSVVGVLDLEIGVKRVERKDPKQGRQLRAWLETQVLPAFEDRMLAVDTAIARCCAYLHLPYPQADCDALLAATALVHNLSMVTRNTGDVAIQGLRVLNPWHYAG